MSPAANTETKKKASDRADKLGGKEFEETFKPKKGPAPKELEKQKGKKKKKGPKLIILALAIVVLVAGAGAALYFSGIANPILAKVGLVTTAAAPSLGPTIEQQQAALEKKAADLVNKEKALNELQIKLDKQQAALASAAAASASPTFETLLSGLSSERLAELKQVGSIYSKMDPASAAAIVTKIYDTKQIAVIVYYMTPAASALVLAKLDPALAADVTKLLTN